MALASEMMDYDSAGASSGGVNELHMCEMMVLFVSMGLTFCVLHSGRSC